MLDSLSDPFGPSRLPKSSGVGGCPVRLLRALLRPLL